MGYCLDHVSPYCKKKEKMSHSALEPKQYVKMHLNTHNVSYAHRWNVLLVTCFTKTEGDFFLPVAKTYILTHNQCLSLSVYVCEKMMNVRMRWQQNWGKSNANVWVWWKYDKKGHTTPNKFGVCIYGYPCMMYAYTQIHEWLM